MTTQASKSVTRLLAAVGAGDASARDRLWKLVYEELSAMARRKMAQEQPGHTLQATALVHEVFLRLTAGEQPNFENRRHFFGAAARAMLRVLIDHGRRRSLHRLSVPLSWVGELFKCDPSEGFSLEDALQLEKALQKLERTDPRKAEIVMLRYFAGLTGEETAQVLGVSRRTIQLEWRFTKAWLLRELSSGDESPKRKSER